MNTSPSGAGSLAQAITDSNNNGPGPNTIDFGIAGSGVKTIQPTSVLPAITVPVTIDGTSEPGYVGTPLIDLDGTNAGSGTPGLTLSSVSSVTVKGLEITAFSGPGIEVTGGSSNVIAGNLIGTDAASTAALGNGTGVDLVNGTQHNTIGGTSAGTGNLISGNSGTGVELDNAGSNTIAGNLIGTDAGGTAALQNGIGVGLSDGSQDNTIGGATASGRNVISGNAFDGVQINGGGVGNAVEGDYIGTNAAGTAALGNGKDGVHIIGGTQGDTVGAGDLISGNGRDGVEFESSSPITPTGANTVEGDMIGTDAAGTGALPNAGRGVSLETDVTNTTVGGTIASARNVISGNSGDGVDVSSGINGVGSLVEGDYIGTSADGAGALGNGGDGVSIVGGTSGATIGGTSAGAGNVISANAVTGVAITRASLTTVAGNRIGTSANGAGKLGNGSNGVLLGAGVSTNTVGGTTASARNVISGNTGSGVLINGAHTTLVEGDYIGTTAGGTAALANSAAGVSITAAAAGTTIGGTTAAARNLVSGNAGDGVSISTDVNAFNNAVEGDYVGLGADGTTPIGNGSDGVYVSGASATIGGTATGAGNAIAHSGGDGVHVDGVNADHDPILSNSIFSNLGTGIALTNGANGGEAPPSVTVGTSAAATTIAGTLAPGHHEVQIFENASCGDPEGASLIGDTSTTGTTWSLAVGNLPAGKGLTATSTNSNASRTSGFSSCVTTTTTTLSASPSTGVPGQPVTYTATIDPSTATGTVAFTDGGNPIAGCGAVPVNGGNAACKQTYGAAGGHSIEATYSATGAFGGSDSSALTEPVRIVTVNATVRTSTGHAVTGQVVKFTAAVAPAPLGGTVSFRVAGKVMAGCATVPVASSTGAATCSTAFGAPGRYPIAVAYSGDEGHTSSSATLIETVRSSVALIASPSGRGGAVKFTVRCAAGSGGCRLSATMRTGRKTVGAKTTTVSAGKKVTVTVKLNSAGRRMLRRAHKLVVSFVLSAKADGDTTTITRRTVNVTAPGVRSKRKK